MQQTTTPRMPLQVGVLGAGMIATVDYGFLPGLQRMSDRAQVVAIASRTRSRAESVARDWQIPHVYDDLDSMLEQADVDVVLNLTPIADHFSTSRRILQARKHLVTEKPLASTLDEATELCELAQRHGLRVVCCPYDMLRPEWLEARKLVQSGALGKVAFARVQSSHAGPAAMSWPADPTWFYQTGAGPLLDMGVYGIDRITGVLGPARRVTAFSGRTAPIRYARGGAFDGLKIDVTEDDNNLVLLDFGDATFSVVDGTFNVVASKAPQMELYGLQGTLLVRRPGAEIPSGELPLELYRIEAAPGFDGWITPRGVGHLPRQDRTTGLFRAALVDHLVECLRTGAG
ncbi:MAG: Gfo/Idh/MocA family oxidoreductase, partial [Chloroflexi bacterium]|nr:Gfo/Idh/MocA family oxidoreductase [Chloroflexota bacterium]